MKALEAVIDFLNDELGIDPGIVLVAFFLVVFLIGATVVNGGQLEYSEILALIIFTSPLWLPLALIPMLYGNWIEYVQVKEIMGKEYALLEIRLPEEIKRTPLAMETVLNVMYHTGEPSDWYAGLIKGESRPQYSLEIASFEGNVRFFIRCRAKQKEMIKSQIYSQYPTVEIIEVDDYAARIQYDENTMELFGLEQKLGKPDPYPIKTYVDWGLDKPGLKDEETVDPINSIIEFMGSLGKGEYCFLQIIIRSHISDKVWGEKMKPDWQKVAEKEVQDLIDKLKSENDGYVVYRPPHEGEKEVMEAIERNVRKKPFDTGIRVIYFGYKDGGFNGDRRAAIPTMFRTFQSHTLNNLKPVFRTVFNWKFQNPFGLRAQARKREIFQAYRWRSYFIPPYPRPYFVLSSEELATLYHFPTGATTTPSLQRTPTRRGEAPSNLPH
jgi:hypothetical protein